MHARRTTHHDVERGRAGTSHPLGRGQHLQRATLALLALLLVAFLFLVSRTRHFELQHTSSSSHAGHDFDTEAHEASHGGADACAARLAALGLDFGERCRSSWVLPLPRQGCCHSDKPSGALQAPSRPVQLCCPKTQRAKATNC